MSTMESQLASRTRAARFIMFFALGGCAALAVVVVPFLGSRSVAPDKGVAPSDFIHEGPVLEGEPCVEPEKVTLTSLQSQSKGVSIRLPDEKAAGAAVTGAFFCGGSETAPVLVVGDVWVFYESGYPESEREAWMAGLAKDYGGKVTSFGGALAYVSPSTEVGVRSQIILSVPSTQEIIRIQAPDGVDIQALERVASSFDVSAAPTSPRG